MADNLHPIFSAILRNHGLQPREPLLGWCDECKWGGIQRSAVYRAHHGSMRGIVHYCDDHAPLEGDNGTYHGPIEGYDETGYHSK